ncbi:MAG: cytidine deaminase [Tannerella sp.]|jgi:cytidine deaminase|nr:cytidine deaminase [Tannerella sp.]
MKTLSFETKAQVFSKEELKRSNPVYAALADEALATAASAYAPYSGFQVGAVALLEDKILVYGNNQENAAYPSGLCAERVTLFSANARHPDKSVEVLAIAALHKGVQTESVSPCGACRQVMFETETRFRHPMKLLLCGKEEIVLIESAAALLPLSFQL